MTNPTRRIIYDGDVLPMVGGPRDGDTMAVDFMFPFLNGGIAPAEWSCKIDGVEYVYALDEEARCWRAVTWETP